MIKKSGYENTYHYMLFILCWVAYFSTYICRLNYSAVMPQLSSSGIFNESQIAAVSSAFFICYGVGQLFSGILGDKYAAHKMIFIGVIVSAVSNILIFFFYKSYVAVIFLWAINGIVQSFVWSPILHIVGEYFNKEEREKFGIDISTTVPLGTLASYGLCLVTLLFLPWNYAFLTCGCIVFIASAVWMVGFQMIKPQLKSVQHCIDTNKASEIEAVSMKQLIKMLAVSGVLILLIPIAIQGTLKDSVTQWIPTFFESKFDLGTSGALLLTMILPVINVTGAYIAKMVNEKLKNELATAMVFFGIATVFLSILLLVGSKSIIIALICMAGVTNCMFAVNVMVITMVPLRFSKYGRVSTVGGFLNAMAYVGCGLLNLVAGKILEKNDSSWTSLFVMWLCLAIIAIFSTMICKKYWKNFTNQ